MNESNEFTLHICSMQKPTPLTHSSSYHLTESSVESPIFPPLLISNSNTPLNEYFDNSIFSASEWAGIDDDPTPDESIPPVDSFNWLTIHEANECRRTKNFIASAVIPQEQLDAYAPVETYTAMIPQGLITVLDQAWMSPEWCNSGNTFRSSREHVSNRKRLNDIVAYLYSVSCDGGEIYYKTLHGIFNHNTKSPGNQTNMVRKAYSKWMKMKSIAHSPEWRMSINPI